MLKVAKIQDILICVFQLGILASHGPNEGVFFLPIADPTPRYIHAHNQQPTTNHFDLTLQTSTSQTCYVWWLIYLEQLQVHKYLIGVSSARNSLSISTSTGCDTSSLQVPHLYSSAEGPSERTVFPKTQFKETGQGSNFAKIK